MPTLTLTRGYVTVVDDIDYEWASQYKWTAAENKNNVYAYRKDKNNKNVYLHREIAERRGLSVAKLHVDHIDRDSLNNRRDNLRVATASSNGMNRGRTRTNRSGVKGVTWCKKSHKWVAKITTSGHCQYLLVSEDKATAGAAYAEAATRLHGEFAYVDGEQPLCGYVQDEYASRKADVGGD